MSSVRLTGALLFVPIPLVLVLYLRRPIGLAPSIVLGVAIMLGHRFVARPFMDRWLARRCFWCGRDLDGPGEDAAFRSRGAVVPARACDRSHAGHVDAFARAVGRARLPLAALIVLPVLLYLFVAGLSIVHRSPVTIDDAVWLFKVPIASAVVALSFLWPLGRHADTPAAIDFPAHNLALLGVRNTLWIFRVVGLIWLVQAVRAALA